MHTTFPLLPTLASLRRTERTTSASTPGIGFPWGQVEGFFRALIKPSSTSAEMACSNRQASSWARDHENPNTSVSKRSERRCRLINTSAAALPLSVRTVPDPGSLSTYPLEHKRVSISVTAVSYTHLTLPTILR